jgi:replicative DNA helicase
MTTRTLPHSTDSEQAIICACFLNPTIITKVQAMIRSEDFYMESHGLLFDAICALGERTELPSVAQWLEDRGTLAQAGGHARLMDLADFTSTSADWLYLPGC